MQFIAALDSSPIIEEAGEPGFSEPGRVGDPQNARQWPLAGLGPSDEPFTREERA